MIYDHDGIHDNVWTVNLYASPNVNARYTSDSISATTWTGDYPVCAVCGKSRGPFAVHHEPPRSKGSLLLRSGMGQFVCKPTLITLCVRCHRLRHDTPELRFRWDWNSPEEEERFLTGGFFKDGYAEHDRRFWEHGRLMATYFGKEVAVHAT